MFSWLVSSNRTIENSNDSWGKCLAGNLSRKRCTCCVKIKYYPDSFCYRTR